MREPPPCSCSTRGPGRCRPLTTSSTCFRTSRAVLESLGGRGVPRIHFGVGTGELLALMRAAGADVVGRRLAGAAAGSRATHRPGGRAPGQPRPSIAPAEWPVVDAEVRRIVTEGHHADGHIFNLGHGVLPDTDPDVLTRIVALLKELTD